MQLGRERPECFVSLSYEGGHYSHAELVLPELNRLGLRATFFLDCLELHSLAVWKCAAELGHELAYIWRGRETLEETDDLLRQLTGLTNNPLLSMGPGEATPERAVRTSQDGFNDSRQVLERKYKSIVMDGWDADDMIYCVEIARQRGQWAILNFCGVGDGEPSVNLADHHRFVRWLVQQNDVQMGTITSIAEQWQARVSPETPEDV